MRPIGRGLPAAIRCAGAGLALYLLGAIGPAGAAHHALLIGISDYSFMPDLPGAVNDVDAFHDALVGHWGYEEQDIVTLKDGAATKAAMRTAIAGLVERSTAGDHVLIYFSGHGTSREDTRTAWPLPYTTGALVPVDFRPSGSLDAQVQSLVVGRWDLRPWLEPLDNGGRQVLVIVDACFSGNAVRGTAATRGLTLRHVALGYDAPLAEGTAGPSPLHAADRPRGDSYPFHNVLYLGAASEFEPATEISAARLADYPTHDGKAHGAFTDALLRFLTGVEAVDDNQDGAFTYAELYDSARRFMADRGYPQTPARLPASGAIASRLMAQPVLGLDYPALTGAAPGGTLAIRVPASFAWLRRQLAGLPGIALTETAPDLTVRRDGNRLHLYRADGGLVASAPAYAPGPLVTYIQSERQRRRAGAPAP